MTDTAPAAFDDLQDFWRGRQVEEQPPARSRGRMAQRRPIKDPRTWPALALAAVLMTLGGVFIISPRLGAAIFGLPAPEGVALAWLAVVGARDLVFGGYVLALALLSTRRAVGVVLGATALIPLADILILLSVEGLALPAHLLLHLASAVIVAATAIWTLRVRSALAGRSP